MSHNAAIPGHSGSVTLVWTHDIPEDDRAWLSSLGIPPNSLSGPAPRNDARRPVIVDSKMRPIAHVNAFLAAISDSVSARTRDSYAYDTRRFVNFLENRRTNVVAATQEDLVAYRKARTEIDGDAVSSATWERDKIVIKLLYRFLIDEQLVPREPWTSAGRRSPIDYPGAVGSPPIRFLSNTQWRLFRDVGLGGQLPDGSLDPRWKVSHPQRNVAGASLALSTGMRLQEFSSVLDLEVPYSAQNAVSFDIAATAKLGRQRTIQVPPETLKLIHLYRRTERAQVVRSTMRAREKQIDALAIVSRVDPVRNRVFATFQGRKQSWEIARMPSALRRVCVRETANGLEPLTLFVGSNGLAPQRRAWSAIFEAASRRVGRMSSLAEVPRMPFRITPHDLRHTFAVVLLRYLMMQASSREASRREGNLGGGSISDHLIHSPILTVQRLLGHASPLTTMVYLRHVEDTELIVRRALDTWNDAELTYADYIGAMFTRGNPSELQ